MCSNVSVAVAMVLALLPCWSAAQPPEGRVVAPQESPSHDVEFLAVLDLGQDPGNFTPKLRGGTVAKSTDWPASLYVMFPTSKGTASCSAALVGPRVMLTAAHCVPPTGKVTFKYGTSTYETACTRHSDYVSKTDLSADYALCRLSADFKAPVGFRYETLDLSAMRNHLNQRVILTGYGCVSDVVGAGPSDKKYRIGSNVIEQTSESKEKSYGPAYYSGQQDNNLITRDDVQAANLCPGDSGGPTFRPTAGGNLGNRTIVGVNSRVFYRDEEQSSYGASLVSAAGGPDFRIWAEAWAAQPPAVAVCGLTGAISNCRN